MKKLIHRAITAGSFGMLLITGTTYGSSGGYSSSPASMNTAGKTDPYSLGMDEVKKKNFAQASGYFKMAMEANPKDADAANMLGYSQRMLGNLDNSMKAYAYALEQRPHFPAAREYLGETYIQAALEQIKILKGYGPEGAKDLQDLTRTFQDAAKTLP